MLDYAVNIASRTGEISGFSATDKPFYLSDYPAGKRKIGKLANQPHDKVVYSIEEGDLEEWLLSCKN